MSISLDLINTMTGIILDGYVNTANKSDFDEAKGKVREFLMGNMTRLAQWAKQRPGVRPPVYFNDQTGDVIWLTRAQSRRLKRRLVKASRARA